MNCYFCQIDLKQEAKALLFAKAVDVWMTHLKSMGVINDWRLSRRKFNLASTENRDFILEITFETLTQMDEAFQFTGRDDDETRELRRAVHDLVAAVDFSLYRPFPDPEKSEHVGIL